MLASDINECDRSPSVCHVNADCQDTEGSFNCSCQTGFLGDGMTCNGNVICSLHVCMHACIYVCILMYISLVSIDTDECALGSDGCNTTTSECVNTVGSFNCSCLTGFTASDGLECVCK